MNPEPKIEINIRTQYLATESDEANRRYVFTYTINIKNVGNSLAQLISRHWIITNAEQRIQEVKGLGVVGHQPMLKPGEQFEYTSGCVLETPFGTMRGSYQMVGDDGTPFEVDIPEFVLAVPHMLH